MTLGHEPARVPSMADGRATWILVVEAAEKLTAERRSPFKLSSLIAEVQRRDSTRERGTIQPVVQGMTVNAGKGPPSPCGKVLQRVDRGYFELRADLADLPRVSLATSQRIGTARQPRRARSLGP